MSFLQICKDNWDERSVSDKKILFLVAILLLLSLFYLMLFEPLITWRKEEQKNFDINTKVYDQVERLVSRFQQQDALNENPDAGLAATVDVSLQKNNIAMKGFQPGQDNTARLRLANVSYESLVQWLYDIEYVHNITIEELSIAKTKADNLLMVNVRLRQ